MSVVTQKVPKCFRQHTHNDHLGPHTLKTKILFSNWIDIVLFFHENQCCFQRRITSNSLSAFSCLHFENIQFSANGPLRVPTPTLGTTVLHNKIMVIWKRFENSTHHHWMSEKKSHFYNIFNDFFYSIYNVTFGLCHWLILGSLWTSKHSMHLKIDAVTIYKQIKLAHNWLQILKKKVQYLMLFVEW